MMEIIGHSKIIKFFDRCIEKGTLSHAYIFSGPEQVGKFTLAVNLAEKILEKNVVLGDNLIIVKPEIEPARNASQAGASSRSDAGGEKGVIKKKDIIVDQVRDLQHSLSLSSGGDTHRIAIIDEADRMNHKAQNAFLKTLEEAREGVILILIVRDEKKMLSTIISRCQKIQFGIVADADLEASIPEGIKNKKELVAWSMGRPGMLATFLASGSELIFHQETWQDLKNIFSQNVGERFDTAEKMSKDVSVATHKLNLWMVVLRNVVLGKKTGLKIERRRALKMLESIEKNLELLNRNNFNSRLILENMFLDI